MDKQKIETTNAPAAVGPYSQAIKTGNFVFLSGQIPINPETKELLKGDIQEQTHQVFKNIKAVLTEANLTLDNIVKATVFLKDMANFKAVNEVYAQYFNQPYPARSAVAVKDLPLSVDVEIEVIAVI